MWLDCMNLHSPFNFVSTEQCTVQIMLQQISWQRQLLRYLIFCSYRYLIFLRDVFPTAVCQSKGVDLLGNTLKKHPVIDKDQNCNKLGSYCSIHGTWLYPGGMHWQTQPSICLDISYGMCSLNNRHKLLFLYIVYFLNPRSKLRCEPFVLGTFLFHLLF